MTSVSKKSEIVAGIMFRSSPFKYAKLQFGVFNEGEAKLSSEVAPSFCQLSPDFLLKHINISRKNFQVLLFKFVETEFFK